MGNDEFMLPNGVVCDRCNGTVLSRLDQTLCDFMPVKMLRTMRGIRNKAGKVPPSSFQAGKLEHVGPSELLVTPNGNDRMLTETGRDGNRAGTGVCRFDPCKGKRPAQQGRPGRARS